MSHPPNIFIMQKFNLAAIILIMLFISSCGPEVSEEKAPNPLIGVWEMVSGVYNFNDTTYLVPDANYPEAKSLKIFSVGYFVTIHQGYHLVDFQAIAGTYKIDGNQYTQTSSFHSSGNEGGEITMKFVIEEGMLKQESSRHSEVWKRIE